MLRKIFELFEEAAGDPHRLTHDDLPLAAAVLLVEVARSDYRHDASEEGHLMHLLRDAFGLDQGEVEELIERARGEADIAVSLDRHVETINRHFSMEEKYELIRNLWEVAMADGDVHHYEEHLVRRLADLLHVPHREFIRAKHAAARRI